MPTRCRTVVPCDLIAVLVFGIYVNRLLRVADGGMVDVTEKDVKKTPDGETQFAKIKQVRV